MADWYRSPDWSISAQRDFEARLARARPAGRAQYLRIKAVALEASGEAAAAVTLWRRSDSSTPALSSLGIRPSGWLPRNRPCSQR